MADPLFSPGAQLAERARTERATTRRSIEMLGTFLADVQTHALAALTPGTAITPFTAVTVHDGWEFHARLLTHSLVDVEDEPEEFRDVLDAFLTSSVPDLVYESTQAVLAEAREHGWSRTAAGRELSKALDVDAPLTRQVPDEPEAVTASLAGFGRTLGSLLLGTAVGAATVLTARRFQRNAARRGLIRQRWVTRRDDKVRPAHAEADGQTRRLGEMFEVGGELLERPGDRQNGSPAMTYNCRCFLVGVR